MHARPGPSMQVRESKTFIQQMRARLTAEELLTKVGHTHRLDLVARVDILLDRNNSLFHAYLISVCKA